MINFESCSNDRTVRVSDLNTKECVHVLEGHTAEVRAVDFDDTKLVSGSRDRSVKVWDCNTGQCLQTMEDHYGTPPSTPPSPPSTLSLTHGLSQDQSNVFK